MNGTLVAQLLAVLCLSGLLITSAVAIFSTSSPEPAFRDESSPSSDETEDVRSGKKSSRFHHQRRQKPNIVIIIADDMGWNDVSFHGSNQIPTPNIDALAYNGVILNKHYVPALCTPSRSALMTGKNPIHLGMQHSVLLPAEPRGLPLTEKLLPQYLKEAGYKTHAVGKWHLGYFRKEYTPTFRGFDSHFGYWNGLQDYYTHYTKEVDPKFRDFVGFDMRRNLTVAWDTLGKYATDLFAGEAVRLINTHDTSQPMFLYLAHLAPHKGNPDKLLRAPDEEIAKFAHILDPERRIYAAVVSKLDQSVGEVTDALRNRGMLENSIIVFMSDNGAPTEGFLSNHGSNYPLRGMKETPWEGGVRGVAAIWSPLIKQPKRVSNQMMFVADWLPTLLSAAEVDKSQLSNIDGFDLWPTLTSNRVSPRSEIVINIDDISNYAAIRRGDFKYVVGETEVGSAWLGATGKPFEGISPEYNPDKVLHSKTGVAISGVITAKQVMELNERRRRRKRDDDGRTFAMNFQEKILTADEILRLRNEAQIKCNVKEKDKVQCDPSKAPCLFNIEKDPCEMVNLADSRPVILAMLERVLWKHRLTVIPPSNMDGDPRSEPSLWNNTWTSWEEPEPMSLSYTFTKEPQIFSGPAVAVMSFIFGLFIVMVMTLIALKYGKFHSKDEDYPEPRNSGPADVRNDEDHLELRNSRFEDVLNDENLIPMPHSVYKLRNSRSTDVLSNHNYPGLRTSRSTDFTDALNDENLVVTSRTVNNLHEENESKDRKKSHD